MLLTRALRQTPRLFRGGSKTRYSGVMTLGYDTPSAVQTGASDTERAKTVSSDKCFRDLSRFYRVITDLDKVDLGRNWARMVQVGQGSPCPPGASARNSASMPLHL